MIRKCGTVSNSSPPRGLVPFVPSVTQAAERKHTRPNPTSFHQRSIFRLPGLKGKRTEKLNCYLISLRFKEWVMDLILGSGDELQKPYLSDTENLLNYLWRLNWTESGLLIAMQFIQSICTLYLCSFMTQYSTFNAGNCVFIRWRWYLNLGI